jgi:TolB-like protein
LHLELACADGLTEDLITDLSRISGLFVIARNSAFAYKGKAMDVRGIAQDLGVRYLLEVAQDAPRGACATTHSWSTR